MSLSPEFKSLFKKLRDYFGEETVQLVIHDLVSTLGGRRVSFPNIKDFDRMIRNNKILSLCIEDGVKAEDLADRFRLSKKQVLNILKSKKNKPA